MCVYQSISSTHQEKENNSHLCKTLPISPYSPEFLVTFPQVTNPSAPTFLVLVLAPHLEGLEGLEESGFCCLGEFAGFRRREFTEEAQVCCSFPRFLT